MGHFRLIFDRRIQIRVEPKQKVRHHAEKATPMRDRGKIPEESENCEFLNPVVIGMHIVVSNVFG